MTDIQRLTARYLNGETSRQEELVLRDFLTNPQSIIPAELEWMSALFAYEQEEAQTDGNKAKTAPRPWYVQRWVASIAVIAVLSVTASLFLHTPPRAYAFIDGQQVTHTETIQQAALEALDIVSATDEETYEALLQ